MGQAPLANKVVAKDVEQCEAIVAPMGQRGGKFARIIAERGARATSFMESGSDVASEPGPLFPGR